MHFSEAALFSLLEFIFRSCRPYNLLLRIDVNFPLSIDHFLFFFVYGYNEAKTPANRIFTSIKDAFKKINQESLMIFRTSFNISSISGANCLSSVC